VDRAGGTARTPSAPLQRLEFAEGGKRPGAGRPLDAGEDCPCRRVAELHLTGMGASYILMLTAFYVDNGKNLPLWRELPQIAFWFLPSAVGLPLILYALLRHPLVRGVGRSFRNLAQSGYDTHRPECAPYLGSRDEDPRVAHNRLHS
jgi:hypothetical protein